MLDQEYSVSTKRNDNLDKTFDTLVEFLTQVTHDTFSACLGAIRKSFSNFDINYLRYQLCDNQAVANYWTSRFDITTYYFEECTLLHVMCKQDNAKAVELLLRLGASLTIPYRLIVVKEIEVDNGMGSTYDFKEGDLINSNVVEDSQVEKELLAFELAEEHSSTHVVTLLTFKSLNDVGLERYFTISNSQPFNPPPRLLKDLIESLERKWSLSSEKRIKNISKNGCYVYYCGWQEKIRGDKPYYYYNTYKVYDLRTQKRIAKAALGDDYWLDEIEVEVKYRRQGIGTDLIKAINKVTKRKLLIPAHGRKNEHAHFLTDEGLALVRACISNSILTREQCEQDVPYITED